MALVGFLWIAPALLGCRPAAAQLYDAYSLAESVTIGERFELVVSVEHDGSRAPLFPHSFLPDSLASRPMFEIGGMTFLGNTPSARRTLGDGWVLDSLRYEVATFELDSAYVPMLPVGLAGEADTLIAGTPPVLVQVKSLVPADAEGIRDITDLAAFPRLAWYWYAIPIALLAALAFWLWKRSRREEEAEEEAAVPEPAEPPWEEAERRLRALERIDLSDPALVKSYYVELADIFRTYLARRTRVPALESTTRELVYRLRRALELGMIPRDMTGDVENVLSQADLVKFADIRPPDEAGRVALARTKTAIHDAETGYAEMERRAREEAARAGNGAVHEPSEIAENAERH